MADVWSPEPELLESLDAAVPEILESQKENGEFGTEPWVCGDQNLILPLAAAWHLNESRYYRNAEVLEAIVRGGDALIHAQDEEGKWTFLKKDYSEWGQILMPWTYSRWIRAYQLVRDALDGDARARWDDALLLGFDGIARTCLAHVPQYTRAPFDGAFLRRYGVRQGGLAKPGAGVHGKGGRRAIDPRVVAGAQWTGRGVQLCLFGISGNLLRDVRRRGGAAGAGPGRRVIMRV